MFLSCTTSEIWRDIGRKSPLLTYPTSVWRPVDAVGILWIFLMSENYRVPGLSSGIVHAFRRFGTVSAYDGRMDRHTTTAYTALA